MPDSNHGATDRSALVNGFQTELELLNRHVRMLRFVDEHGPIGIIRLSSLLGEPKHKVRYSLRILEKEGFIRASPRGATATERVPEFFAELTGLLDDIHGQIRDLLANVEAPKAQ